MSNITDVGHLSEDDYADAQGEDKMQRALHSKDGKAFPTIWDLARYYADAFSHDWKELNLVEPDVRPRATEHVAQQIEGIGKLIDRGCAYETAMGVYFSVAAHPNYGRLSGNVTAEDLSGSRDVIVDPSKRDPRDFALWKKDSKHLMRWFSPWGWGFPGWHIECSVMAMEYLGATLDLHSGGLDNKFPHHECEIAQSESLTGELFVKHWAHTGYLQVNGEKMSKSRGNFFTLRDLIYGGQQPGPYQLHPLALRYALTSARYREPFNFTLDHAKACGKLVNRIHETYTLAQDSAGQGRAGRDNLGPDLSALYDQLLAAMCDDLNTSAAYTLVLKGASLIQKSGPSLTTAAAASAVRWFKGINRLLGIVEQDALVAMMPATQTGRDPFESQVEQLVEERDRARRAMNFGRADEVKRQLIAMGIEIRDAAQGTTWRRSIRPPDKSSY